MSTNNLTKGSVWRKWDLQVQTRLDANYTCLGNNSLSMADLQKLITATGLTETEITAQEKEIDAQKYAKLFIKYVELFTDISVFGITDHNAGGEIDTLINEAKNSSREIAILPGVEVSSAQGLHILCLFDPEKKWRDNWAESIDHFLTEIGLTNGVFNAQNQPLNSTKTAQEILTITNKKGGLCIFAHIGTDNGLFKFSNTASGGNAHISVYKDKLCQIVQLPRSANLSNGVQNIIEGKDPQYGNKSVTQIKCSDARKLTEIGACFTWIKADPTFEGLKQILYEPLERVKIQQTNPFGDRQKIYINSLEFTGRTNFLIPNIKIPLNRELITIIGGRGSGKSALLESIAFLNEEHGKEDQNKKKKIIHHFRTNEDGKDPAPDFSITVDLIDKDGNSDEHKKGLHEEEDLRLPFLYIGQEQLSIKATDDKDLTKTICKVLNIDPADIQNNKIIDNSRSVLAEINIAESELNDLLSKYSGFQNGNFTTWLDDQLLKRENQKKKISSQSTKDLLGDIDKANEKRQKLNELYIELDHLKSSIESIDINDQIKVANNDLQSYYLDREDAIPLIETNKQLQVIGKFLVKIESNIKEVDKTINEKKNALTKLGLKEDVSVLLRSAESLQQEIGIFARDKKRYEELIKILEEQKNKRNEIYNSVSNYLSGVKKKIDDKFVEFLQSRNASNEDEKELFNSIVKGVGIEGKINFDQDKFCKDILAEYSFVDKRTIKNITELKAQIAGKDKAGKSKDITLDILKGWISSSLEEFLTNPALRDKAGFLEYLFTRWDEFVSVNAIVKLDDVAIPKLSIGQRGTLLLKIYLSSASVKQIFIIDQPEDNLDNQFIMHELVPLIRKIKKSRQIIMSTHNANLVVNSDAEQVIVARLYPNDDYISGGIEDPRINNDIKEILEGGEEAFRSRENKYGMAIIN